MFNIGGWEMAILVMAGLMFFGPDKLPQLMRQAGKIYRQIQKASSEFQYSISRELEEDKYKKAHRREKKRKKKLAEAGLLDADGNPTTGPATAPAPAGTVPVPPTELPPATPAVASTPAVAEPATVENTVQPPSAPPDNTVAVDSEKKKTA